MQKKADILQFAHRAMDLVPLQTCGGIFESEQQDHQMRWPPGTKSGVIHPIDLISPGLTLMLDIGRILPVTQYLYCTIYFDSTCMPEMSEMSQVHWQSSWRNANFQVQTQMRESL